LVSDALGGTYTSVCLGTVLRRIFGPKRDEVTGGWRKLHNEELHNLYSLPSIITIIRSRKIKLAGHIVYIYIYTNDGEEECMYVISGKAGMKDTTKNTKTKVDG
jgi:hypothetical protein